MTRVRARIGLIIPSSNRLTEPHMRRYAPEGVEVHFTRLRMTGAQHVPLDDLLPRIVEATLALGDARCDVICFHCTASAMEAGLSGERRTLDAMRSAVAAEVATTATAALAALQALAIGRVALFSPYRTTTHQLEVKFLQAAGVQVVGARALGLNGGDDYISVPPEEWLRIASNETPVDADGALLSCNNIHAPEVIAPLERTLGRPVVSSNQVVLWHALRTCGVDDDVSELGQLFRIASQMREVSAI